MDHSKGKALYVAGNWKMNLLPREGVELARGLQAACAQRSLEGVHVMLFPPAPHLAAVSLLAGSTLLVGAQDCSSHPHGGAFTGEVSAAMVADCGASWVLVGHSERRGYHGEDSELLEAKIRQAVGAGLGVVYCCGEPLEVREGGDQTAMDYVIRQLEILRTVWRDAPGLRGHLLVAYEPIWAIGTGRVASPEQAQAMCEGIDGWCQRELGVPEYGVPVLYGGSCNAKNAGQLFGQRHISGGLIGGASLKQDDFMQIVEAARAQRGL